MRYRFANLPNAVIVAVAILAFVAGYAAPHGLIASAASPAPTPSAKGYDHNPIGNYLDGTIVLSRAENDVVNACSGRCSVAFHYVTEQYPHYAVVAPRCPGGTANCQEFSGVVGMTSLTLENNEIVRHPPDGKAERLKIAGTITLSPVK